MGHSKRPVSLAFLTSAASIQLFTIKILQCKSFSAFESSGLKNLTSSLCAHAGTETMYSCMYSFFRLICHLHRYNTSLSDSFSKILCAPASGMQQIFSWQNIISHYTHTGAFSQEIILFFLLFIYIRQRILCLPPHLTYKGWTLCSSHSYESSSKLLSEYNSSSSVFYDPAIEYDHLFYLFKKLFHIQNVEKWKTLFITNNFPLYVENLWTAGFFYSQSCLSKGWNTGFTWIIIIFHIVKCYSHFFGL